MPKPQRVILTYGQKMDLSGILNEVYRRYTKKKGVLQRSIFENVKYNRRFIHYLNIMYFRFPELPVYDEMPRS